MRLPKVSIIIPVYNEEKTIGKCLNSIRNANYPKNKIQTIVVDDGSTDNTREIISKFDVKLIKGKHRGVGISRNLGIKASKGEIIMFIDADEILYKNFIIEAVKPFKNKDIVGTDPSLKLVNDKSPIARLYALKHILSENQYDSAYPKICKKEVIDKVGKIRPEFGYYDDWDFKNRISKQGKIVRAKKAIYGLIEPENMKEVWRQSRWAGKSVIKLFRNYKKETMRKLLFPLLCAPIPIYILLLFTPLRILGMLGILAFLVIELRRTFSMYKISKWKVSFLTPLFDILTMGMYSVGILLGIVDFKSIPKA